MEWGVALALGQGADACLGTQGDPWDTPSDMFFALIGAVTVLSRPLATNRPAIGSSVAFVSRWATRSSTPAPDKPIPVAPGAPVV
jgi:hypothetical protein